jgi:hypothetical protein
LPIAAAALVAKNIFGGYDSQVTLSVEISFITAKGDL